MFLYLVEGHPVQGLAYLVAIPPPCEEIRLQVADGLGSVCRPPHEQEGRTDVGRIGVAVVDVEVHRIGATVGALEGGGALMLRDIPAERSVWDHFLVNASFKTLMAMKATLAGRSAKRRIR